MGTPPVNANGSLTGVNLISLLADYQRRPAAVVNVEVDGNNQSTTYGILASNNYTAIVRRCIARNCTFYGISGGSFNSAELCLATGCGYGFTGFKTLVGCTARGNNSGGFHSTGDVVNCVAYGNTGAGFDSDYVHGRFIRSIAYGNTTDGFATAFDIMQMQQCISYGNGGYGLASGGSGYPGVTILGCAFGNNTSGNHNFTPSYSDPLGVALTADPFVDPTNGDFNINATSGGGAGLRLVTFTIPW